MNDFVTEIYPMDAITSMLKDNYKPIIIASNHKLEIISHETLTLLKYHNGIQQKVLHEILPPIQLTYIKQFLQDEIEYKENGTINGQIPSSQTIFYLQRYRGKLAMNHAGDLAIWMLDHGLDVQSLEHPSVMQKNQLNEESFKSHFGFEFDYKAKWILRFFKSLKRDICNLQTVNKERPDFITLGAAHAVIYDYLLQRDGSRSFYFPESTRFLLNENKQLYIAAQNYYLETFNK